MRIIFGLIVYLSIPPFAAAQTPGAIPDFCASPTKTAATGNYGTAGTWTPSGAPSSTDIAIVPSGVTVTVNTTGLAAKSLCVESGGTLIYATSANTELVVTTLRVESGGALTIGDAAGTCINAANTAYLTFRDEAPDVGTVGTPGIDPEQFGTGLVAEGAVRMCGATKTPFVRLAAEVADTDTTVTAASTPTGWLSGDSVTIPESIGRKYTISSCPTLGAGSCVHWDDRRVLSANVTTTSITVTAGMTYDHPCGKNAAGTCEYYPHIVNLTRNVIIRSANASGTRGHTFFTHMADVDIRYALFKDLGRTTTDNLHCTLFTTSAVQGNGDCNAGTGTLTQIGTNQKGRYAIHLHHLWGPENIPNTGYQGTLLGNAVVDSKKWPITLHWASYILVQSNVVAYYQGPGIFMEEYHEHYNMIDGNFMTAASSDKRARGQDDADGALVTNGTGAGGREPAGFWARTAHNYVRNNVAAGMWSTASPEIIAEVGFKIHIPANGATTRIPDFRGADLTDADDYTTADVQDLPMLEFADNEAYGLSTGMTVWQHGTDGATAVTAAMTESVVDGLVTWHFWEGGFFGYPIHNYRFQGMVCRGDVTNSIYDAAKTPYCWSSGDYKNHTITLAGMNAQNVHTTVVSTEGVDGPLVISDLTSKSAVGIEVKGFYTPGANHAPLAATRTTTITNLSHTTLAGYTNRPIWMNFNPTSASYDPPFYADTLPYVTTVTNYQGTGVGFSLYFAEQEAESVAGGLAPCADDTTYAEIIGLVCGINSGRKRLRLRGSLDPDSQHARPRLAQLVMALPVDRGDAHDGMTSWSAAQPPSRLQTLEVPLLITMIAAAGADTYTTGYGIGSGQFKEVNPFLRPLQKRPFVFGAVKMGLSVGAGYAVHKLFHINEKVAWVVGGVTAGAWTYAAWRNQRLIDQAEGR